ncbi:murein hydrolase activator EnvC family protein [Petrocella sp. FN5]|uniref:murein hydrolase activator EnvC family protein n=1 Tax=Petrocella sp. FN5 TaxID=3032002 RepID=UPI0023D9CE25|nr:M23 family metallopeptidase [Petrocella sp. FN5]MDF1615960.1 peptidoglycan DD-metalloendopeptidase family protein [Petrocella sp. FN5]
MKKKFLVLALLMMSLILGTHVHGSKMEELEKKKENIEKEFETVQKNLANTKTELKVALQSIEKIEVDILDTEFLLNDLNRQIETKHIEIEDTLIELNNIKQEKDILNEQAKDRIKVMYEYGNSGYLEVLFASKDMVDFFNRLEYINRLLEFDNKLFKNLEDIEVSITEKEAKLKAEEVQLSHMSAETNLKKIQLEDKILTKNQEVANYSEDQKVYENMMIELEKAEKAVDAEIKELIRRSTLVYKGGKMEWPVPGWYRISSPFGPRVHPIFKTTRMHNGIDIAAPGGIPITAAEKGVVILSKYSSSYGNYIIIDHGSGYATIYAHCSKLLVTTGQAVTRGEKIAEIGSTGWSTGNHLHFGIQIHGEWVDPMLYVK